MLIIYSAHGLQGGQYSQILTAITSAAGSNISGSIGEMGTNALINYVQGLGAAGVVGLNNLST